MSPEFSRACRKAGFFLAPLIVKSSLLLDTRGQFRAFPLGAEEVREVWCRVSCRFLLCVGEHGRMVCGPGVPAAACRHDPTAWHWIHLTRGLRWRV